MPIDWNEEVIDQINTHWQERLRPRLEGLTDDEYFWQPVPNCWTISRRGEGSAPISFGAGAFTMDYAEPPHDPEPVTTIAWRLAHVTVNLASTNGKRFGRPATNESTFLFAGTAREALEQLDDQYDHWITGVRGLGTAGLIEPQGEPPAFAHAPMARKCLYANVELIHHGAEICLLRDLYLHRGPVDVADDGS
ncbi:DinB family protein [Kribbella sp. NPDC051586]|uniref:DinB family protein n=1 Tax=Kribbella sp. NPDC051586 TaxID=3364118 RepID=UPI003797C7F6